MKSLHILNHQRWLNPSLASQHELCELELLGAWELPMSSRNFVYSKR